MNPITINGRQIGQSSSSPTVQNYLDVMHWVFHSLQFQSAGANEWIVYGAAPGHALLFSDFSAHVDIVLPYGWKECNNGYEASHEYSHREADKQEAIKFREGLIADFLRRNPHCKVREQQALMIFLVEHPWNPEELRAKMVLEAIENGQSEEDIEMLKRYPLCPTFEAYKMAQRLEQLHTKYITEGDLSHHEEEVMDQLEHYLSWHLPRY